MSFPVFHRSFWKRIVLVFPTTIMLLNQECFGNCNQSQEIKVDNFQMNA